MIQILKKSNKLMLLKKSTLIISGFWAVLVMSFTTGCASGGYKLTRKYAGFVNGQHIILRIVLYLLTSIVFAVTMIIDLVVFNTMDFWEGRVSQGTFEFNQDGKTYYVEHRYQNENKLRESRITIVSNVENFNTKSNVVKFIGPLKSQEVILRETASHEIEVFLDGKLHAKVSDITKIPILSLFDAQGTKKSSSVLSSVATPETLSGPLFKVAAN